MTGKLTIAEVDALFFASLAPAPPKPRSPQSARAWVARYDRCAGCREITPALMSFSGDTDWSPQLPLDDPLRDAVKALRASSGRRTILLCSVCCDELRHYRVATVATETPARLFEP